MRLKDMLAFLRPLDENLQTNKASVCERHAVFCCEPCCWQAGNMISFEVWQKCYKDRLSFVASI